MALASEISAQQFLGNNSTTTPYVVTFAVHSAADIKVEVKALGALVYTLLGPAQYTVHEVAGVFTVTTTVAYPATTNLTIYRWLPLTQPLILPLAGSLPGPGIERGLDRLVMQIQQYLRILTGLGTVTTPGAVTIQGIQIFANEAARNLAVREYANQLGLQADTGVLYWGTGPAAGAWTPINPKPGTVPVNKLVIAATADTGIPGTTQNAIISRLYDWAVNAVICAGDNHYTPDTFDASWAAFAAFIADGKVYPALGNHDSADWTAHAAKFPYIPASPANRRYYTLSLGNGLIDLFFLHSGRDNFWAAIEPDGNYVGSVQHAWFVAALAASKARWKVAVFHHPPVTASAEANRADINLDWPEFAQLDGIICGHVHFTEWLTCRGTPLVNVSGGVNRDGDVHDLLNLTGTDTLGSDLLWHDDRRRLMAKLTITPTRLLVGIHDIFTGALVYQRDLSDKTAHRHEWGQEVVGPNDLVPLGIVPVGICPAPLARGSWIITAQATGASLLAGTVLVDDSIAGMWEIPAGSMWVEVTSLRNVRRGALVKVNITTNAAYGAWYGLGVYYRGQIVG